jgi:hypothetical protein
LSAFGELGETFFITPKDLIPAKTFMVIGLGEEKDLSLDTSNVVGRIAVREAVRLKAKHVAWAPVIRDEGNTTIEVGAGDKEFSPWRWMELPLLCLPELNLRYEYAFFFFICGISIYILVNSYGQFDFLF